MSTLPERKEGWVKEEVVSTLRKERRQRTKKKKSEGCSEA